jgi:hypothetical protein
MTLNRRIYFSFVAVAIAACASIVYRYLNPSAIFDLYFPFCAARVIRLGLGDPYKMCIVAYGGRIYANYPMTTIVAAMPFEPLGYMGALLLWSLEVGLLTFGILRTGQYWRLLMFATVPFYQAFISLQWSPLLAALMFLPELLPLALIKPHIGLPIILTNLTRRRFIACAAFGLFTFVIDPLWPLKWWEHALTYDGAIPLLTMPVGLMLPLVLLRRNDSRARFTGLMSLVPQRGFYDTFALWTITSSPRELLALSAFNWIGFAIASLIPAWSYPLIFGTCYLPVLAFILRPTAAEWRRRLELRISARHSSVRL